MDHVKAKWMITCLHVGSRGLVGLDNQATCNWTKIPTVICNGLSFYTLLLDSATDLETIPEKPHKPLTPKLPLLLLLIFFFKMAPT